MLKGNDPKCRFVSAVTALLLLLQPLAAHATAVTSYQGGAAKQALVSQQASITADASLDITAGRDVAAAGAKIASNSDASLNAGRDVALGSVAVSDGYTVGDSRYTASYARTRNMGSTVEAGNNLNITAAGDVALAGSTAKAGNDATVTAGGNVTATTVQDTESFTSQSRTKSGGFFGGSKTVSSSSSSTSNIGSAITAGNNVNVTAQGGDVAVIASKVDAGQDANLTASNNVALGVAYDEKSSTSSSSSKSMLASSSKTSESQKSTAVGSTVTAGRDVNATAQTGDVSVTASTVVAGNAANLTSQEGQVQFLAAKDSESSSSTSTSSNPVWWKNQGKGSVDETVKVASLTTGEGGLNVTAKTGVVVEGKAGLKESIATDPKLAWMAPLAKRNDVTFKAVNEAHEKWDYKQQGLSAPAAAVIALAVTIATDGMGSGLLGGMGVGGLTTTGAGGAAVATTTGTMVNAGFSALVSQAAVGMINHQGDLGAVLKDMGSVETLKNLAITVAAAGAFYQVGTLTDGHASNLTANGKNPLDYIGTTKYFQNVAGHAAIGAGVSALKGENILAGAAAAGIGSAVAPSVLNMGKLAGFTTTAAVGGATSKLTGGSFATGATTAGLGYLYNACGGDPLCFAKESWDSFRGGVSNFAEHVSNDPLGTAESALNSFPQTRIEGEVAGLAIGAIKSFGSTGRTVALSLKEQLAMEQAMKSPEMGEVVKGITMNDKRWPASQGWVKVQQVVNGVNIHYVRNTITGVVDDFKFK